MTTEAKVGAFVIFSTLVLGSATYLVRSTQTGRAQVPYKTHLHYAGGLNAGAPVLFSGIKVGQVTSVEPWSDDPTQIEIGFTVKSGIPLNQTSTATVGTVTVMTAPALMITTRSKTARLIAAGGVVPSAEPVNLEELEAKVSSLAVSADSVLVEVRKDIPALTDGARTLLANLNQITGTQNQKRIEQTLVNLNALLERESPKIAQITDQISDLAKHANSVIGSVEPVISHADHAVVNVDQTVDAIRDPLAKDLAELQSTIQAAHTALADVHNIIGSNQYDIGETVRNLRSTSENIRVLSESLKQRPWSLIRTKQPADRRIPQ